MLTDAAGFYLFDRRTFPAMQPSSPYTLFISLAQTPLDGLQPTLDGSRAPNQPVPVGVDSNGVWDRASALSAAAISSPAFGGSDMTFDFGFTPRFGACAAGWRTHTHQHWYRLGRFLV